MRALPQPKFRAGYSFTEVMFAVVILGIGFIMIAAIFPAAIHQGKTTAEETSAATMSRAAAQYMSVLAEYSLAPPHMPAFPADGPRGKVRSLHNPQNAGTLPLPLGAQLWDAARGNLISPNDSRLGWVGFYKRDPGAPVQLIIVTCEVRNRPVYSPGTVPPGIDTPPDPAFANLQGRPIRIAVDRAFDPPHAVITEDPALVGGNNAAIEGAYVIIASDNVAAPNAGIFNGHIFRLGADLGGGIFEFAGGNDYVADSGPNGLNDNGGGDDINLPAPTDNPAFAEAFIVGRAYIGGAGTTASPALFEGIAQDISVYTRFK
jgi:type II secretory pathway pseudopilin PulG